MGHHYWLHTRGSPVSFQQERVRVPAREELCAMRDDEIAALSVELDGAIDSCRESVQTNKATGRSSDGVMSALKVYEHGKRKVVEVQRARAGESAVRFEAARPVTDWVTSYVALKAHMRLIGLCQAEHQAVRDWLAADDGDDAVWQAAADRIETAHNEVERAFSEATTS